MVGRVYQECYRRYDEEKMGLLEASVIFCAQIYIKRLHKPNEEKSN